MSRWYRAFALTVVALCAVWLATGCGEHERRKVTVHEEQREGEVTEEKPGEMIIE